jgi:hypothetical protein
MTPQERAPDHPVFRRRRRHRRFPQRHRCAESSPCDWLLGTANEDELDQLFAGDFLEDKLNGGSGEDLLLLLGSDRQVGGGKKK